MEHQDHPVTTEPQDSPVTTELQDTPVNSGPQDSPVTTELQDTPVTTQSRQISPDARKHPLRRRILAGILAAVLLIAGGVGIWIAADPHDFRMVEGVSVGGLDISGLTPFEAHRVLKEAVDTKLLTTGLLLELPQEDVTLSPGQAGLSVQVWKAVADAFQGGRDTDTSTLGLLPYLEYDEISIRMCLSGYAEKYDTHYTPSSWTLKGDAPELSREDQPEPPAGQTLLLTMGTPGTRLDMEDAFRKILQMYNSPFPALDDGAYALQDFKVLIPEPVLDPDVKAIYEELYVAPVDDSLDMEHYQPIPGAYGYGFDLQEARKQVWNASHGQVIQIPMTLIMPEIAGDQVYFRDLLGYCETPHTNNENRNHNLMMSCQAMDGVILQPGEVFSYNETLGERTAERGWKKAGAYSGTRLVQSYGGGICQGSSTIYCAALYADLEIIFRINHGFTVSYLKAGLDATVSWNGPDFKFANNTNFPIKIAAEVSDGYVKVGIWGTEERNYYVEMEATESWTEDAIYARSYKCKYDRETGELISRELEARSSYMR